MKSYNILKKLNESKITVVIRGDTIEQAEKIVAACVNGGVKSLEITFTVPKAHHLLEKIREKYDSVVVGAGTVLDSETARLAILSGADFIVSPHFDVETAKLCNRYCIPYLPGCMTINEMIHAIEYGVTIIKLFPGQLFSPSIIQNIKGPLPYIQIMPTGGISLDNLNTWLDAGATLVGVGSDITYPAKDDHYDRVEKLASKFVRMAIQNGK
ncbi:bifunctional 2-keto-4-hydroxyglutarate aldolase/2-keto-3-deoxy-6-phosphogluconate aldolase [Pseudogracilibacillus auburnensis]|uniref:2-dehydro-3-deoxyphosphogluconate aldolase/(4S)-4-hydroxy-2-oxoglutarate aldolase n=1 Tax=Pseudogracilibacillus auburnensis TaxID=1494959 RepID=A0A2V3W5T0_9BACI|nr:bifunctional 2-keto-4-hydroxyglutarate aldolase/2-keto-3-deoxy-6-phosphogluconate aldolase [Pseudogracilibacillus auburnensis]MBO1001716.1 bifunctional 2-keto-4-hydroxyglutarate aldolase/2-keto-3-deoxy-6-phosphogluconate aldolase [Pseudogracilibacillus auburnensis]PXW89360.1 2-dehydro-3-deoxyphosphogluconate aldolase/(4S)-4-hydroxy-2-oxoglutarate aldolase [Pseudogracilibacillus auburnensis]